MKQNTWRWVAGGGAGLLVIGSLMAWVKIAFASASGIDGGDGWITVIGGVIAGLLAFRGSGRSQRIGLIVVGLAMAALVVYEFINISTATNAFDLSPSIGTGLYACALGAGAVIVAGFKPPIAEAPSAPTTGADGVDQQ